MSRRGSLRRAVTRSFFAVADELADFGVEVLQLEQEGVDLRLERLADGVLLGDELVGLLLLDLLLEDFDTGLFRL